MRKIIELRNALNKTNNLDTMNSIKDSVLSIQGEYHFQNERESVEDLISDIEDKINSINGFVVQLRKDQDEYHRLSENESLEGDSAIQVRPRLVESIIPSVNCTLYLEKGCTLREIERESIRVTLTRNKDNRTVTARELGISVRTLRNKLNEYLDNGEVAVYELSRIR